MQVLKRCPRSVSFPVQPVPKQVTAYSIIKGKDVRSERQDKRNVGASLRNPVCTSVYSDHTTKAVWARV